MRVFMLGWEFPPSISGGLGTACFGLTKALSRQEADIIFVLPRPVQPLVSSHVKLLSPRSPQPPVPAAAAQRASRLAQMPITAAEPKPAEHAFQRVQFKTIPTWITSPYQAVHPSYAQKVQHTAHAEPEPGLEPISHLSLGPHAGGSSPQPGTHYQGDMIQEAQRYAQLCVALALAEEFDVIHAHDWLTFPAGLAVAAATGKPLVVHVHSTEFDRSGLSVHQPIYDIERRGMHGAMKVIAVSHLTRSIIIHRYGVAPEKVEVVYNGIETNGHTPDPGLTLRRAAIKRSDKIVLFLGRITMQKGPEYFVRAAKKVLEKFDAVKFIMAGSGDKVPDVIELAAAEGIGHKILFTGFLAGKDVDRVFKTADLYVMPSVSEPFGIAPLEAISHDVPVIISKTSGVSEVLTNALKVDFWDVDEMANKIIAVLRHPPLSATLREHADMEVRRLTWDDAAQKCKSVYEDAMAQMPV